MPYKDPAKARECQRRLYERDRAKILAQRKLHNVNEELRLARKEKKRARERTPEHLAKKRAYHKRRPDVGRRGTAKWIASHREEARAMRKSWYWRNRERVLARRKEYYQENKHRIRAGQPELKRRHTLGVYGLTVEAYDAMLESQGHACSVCGSRDSGSKSKHFHVDHCHATGQVRGLLCKRCNNGLGFFDDNVDRMAAAIEYLRKYKEQECPSAAQTA